MPSNYVSDSNQLLDSSKEVDSSDSNLRSVFRSNFAKFDWDETGLTDYVYYNRACIWAPSIF